MALSPAEAAYVEWSTTDPDLKALRDEIAAAYEQLAHVQALVTELCSVKLAEFERIHGDVTL